MTQAEATFVDLYDAHYDEVHAYCARRVGWADADDAAAEVFAVVWRRIDDVEARTARAWLFGVARGVIRNKWRSASRRSRLIDRAAGHADQPAGGPESVVVRRSELEVVLEALSSLKESDQEILRLAAWEELTGPEIASVLGISIGAVHQRLSRAKRRLAGRLAPMEGGVG